MERQLAQAECRAAESQAACEDAQAQLLAAREHQQELSRQVYIAKQAEQQLRAKVGPALAWQVLQGKGTPVVRGSADEHAGLLQTVPEVYSHTAAEGTCRVAVPDHEDQKPAVQ